MLYYLSQYWFTYTFLGTAIYVLILRFKHLHGKIHELYTKQKELLHYLEDIDKEMQITHNTMVKYHKDIALRLTEIQTVYEHKYVLRKYSKENIYMYIHHVSEDIQILDIFKPSTPSTDAYYHRIILYKDTPVIPMDRVYWIRKPWAVTQFVSEYLDELQNK